MLGFAPKYEMHRTIFEQPKNRDTVEAVMAEVLGRPYHLRCVAMSDADLAAARAAVRRATPADAGPPDPASPRRACAKPSKSLTRISRGDAPHLSARLSRRHPSGLR